MKIEKEKLYTINILHHEAVVAAKKAVTDFIEKHGEPFYCGFAGVVVKGVRGNSRVGKRLKELGFNDNYGGGLYFSNPAGFNLTYQSMDLKEIGAEKYAEMFREFGFDAHMSSNPD
tara:strand:- start:186 stop:533 length:348 start_codon:yes stop_codon:yes gene_type:complete